MEENKERQDKKGSALSQLKAQREQKLRDGEWFRCRRLVRSTCGGGR